MYVCDECDVYYLGVWSRIFRIALYGRDDFDYAALAAGRLTRHVWYCIYERMYVCMYVCMYV